MILQGTASSEGGPFLIGAVEDFADWNGTEAATPAKYRVVVYGSLLKELPAKFMMNSDFDDHQTFRFPTEDGARRFAGTLMEEIRKNHPDVKERVQKAMSPEELVRKARAAMTPGQAESKKPEDQKAMAEWLASWKDHIEQGVDFMRGEETVLHLGLDPDSDYSRVCDSLPDQMMLIAGFGPSSRAYFWDVGPGILELYRADDQNEFILFRSDFEDEKLKRGALNEAQKVRGNPMKGHLNFPSGRGIFVWSAVCPLDIEYLVDKANALLSSRNSIQVDSADIKNVGLLFAIEAGNYTISSGQGVIGEDEYSWVKIARLQS